MGSDPIHETLREAEKRGLRFLLIGGNALRLQGYLRSTLDLDILVPQVSFAEWRGFLERRGYEVFHATEAFAQFEPVRAGSHLPIDLMIVDGGTWEKLAASAESFPMGGIRVAVPRPEHLVALKLHAATSKHRSRRELDWEDIRQLVQRRRLDPSEPLFQEIIMRYGGKDALERIARYFDEIEGQD